MNEKELIEGIVGKTLNVPNEKIAEILYAEDGTLKSDALDNIVNLDAQRIQKLKDEHKAEETKIHDKGYKKAQSESLTKFESELKEEFGVPDSQSKGKDLVKEIVSKMAKDTGLTEEAVKLHPKFLELERKLTGEYVPKTDFEKVNTEFSDYKKTFERRQILQTVTSDAIKVFRSLKPVLPSDPTLAANQEAFFLEKLGAFDYEVQQDGNHIITIDGKRLETPNGHPVSFQDFVKGEAAKYFPFQVQDGKGNAGQEDGKGNPVIVMPTTEEEYKNALAMCADPQQRVKIMLYWKEKHK
jgi:hypothetical protein